MKFLFFKRHLLALLCILGSLCSIPLTAFTQWLEKDPYSCTHPHPFLSHDATARPYRSIDVLHYALSLRLSMQDGNLRGVARIRSRVNALSLHRLSLSAAALIIDSVCNLQGLPLSFQHQGDSLHITLPLSALHSDTLTLTIFYRANAGRRGYYFYTAQESGSEPIGYTMSQPYDARYWFPCLDEPDDKATAEISITVPKGFTAASVGRLMRVEELGSEVTYHWATEFPIATYLMCITVSRYTILRDTLVRTVRPPTVPSLPPALDRLPIEYYVWREDSLSAVGFFRNVTRMIQMCDSIFGISYPFEKYGQAAVRPFAFGGMEHQTLSTLHRNLLWNENLLVHELAHQWWGDMVTCESWRDLWLNEGFATYAEALWQEYLHGKEGLRRYMRSRIRPHLWHTPIYNASPLFSDVVYGKAAWVLHMLRGLMGDLRFKNLLRQYGEQYKFAHANTADFQHLAEALWGSSLEWFFQQWIFGTGIPKLEYTWRALLHTTGWQVEVHIRQTQREPVFILPMELQLYTAGRREVFQYTMQSRDTTFRFIAQSEPQQLVLDEDDWLLKEAINLTDLQSRSRPVHSFRLEQNYPNPFNPTTTIRYEVPRTAFVTLKVFDVLGRAVATLVQARQAAGRYDVLFNATGLPSGLYFYRLETEGFTATKKMTLLR